MSRPSPLEIQDALFGGALRTAVYATAAIAIAVLAAPWQAGPEGMVWTWDIWGGSEVFFLLPAMAGLLLGVAGAFEGIPGIALGLGALASGLAWLLVCADEFAPAFAAWSGGVEDRDALARIVILVLLAGLAFRRALHRSLAARIVLGLGAVGTLCLFFVPLGGAMLFETVVLDPLGTGELGPSLAAVGPALTLLAGGAALAALLPSPRGTGGLSALTLVLLHVVAAAVAFAHLPPFVATLGDIDLSYGVFVAPLKLGGLTWVVLTWIGLGAGTAGAALEAKLRGEPLPGRKPLRSEPRAPGGPLPGGRPVALGQPVVLPAASAASTASGSAPAPLDLSPLPAPPGFAGGALPDEVPQQLHSREPSEIVELSSKHALPLLETTAAPAAAPVPAAITPAPAMLPTPPPVAPPPPPRVSVPPMPPVVVPAAAPAPATAAPRAAFRARTQLGMPPSQAPGTGRGPTPAPVSRPEESGRTGDTNLGLPVARPRPPGAAAPAAPAESSEVSGLRFWPPPAGADALPPSRDGAATPAFGVEMMRDVAAMRQTPSVVPPTAGVKPARPAAPAAVRPAASAAVRPAEPARAAASDSSDAVRHRISGLQRQLARGEITADQYQQRLDEILKSRS